MTSKATHGGRYKYKGSTQKGLLDGDKTTLYLDYGCRTSIYTWDKVAQNYTYTHVSLCKN